MALSREEQIRKRAYELYVLRGNRPGSQMDDWLQAEKEALEVEDLGVDEASEDSFPASDPPSH